MSWKRCNIDELQLAFNNAVQSGRTGTAVVEEFVSGEEQSRHASKRNRHILHIRVLDKIPVSMVLLFERKVSMRLCRNYELFR